MALTLRQVIPPLTARTASGEIVRAWDFKQKKSLVVAFLHAECPRCGAYLEKLAAHCADLAERDAVSLIVFDRPPRAVGLPAPIVLCADISGRSQLAYLGNDAFGPAGLQQVGVFVADRYGELFAQWQAADAHGLAGVREALGWLAQVQVACEECGAPHWLADS